MFLFFHFQYLIKLSLEKYGTTISLLLDVCVLTDLRLQSSEYYLEMVAIFPPQNGLSIAEMLHYSQKLTY